MKMTAQHHQIRKMNLWKKVRIRVYDFCVGTCKCLQLFVDGFIGSLHSKLMTRMNTFGEWMKVQNLANNVTPTAAQVWMGSEHTG